ncbi:MAG: DUF4197 domain-containing protein [Ferruginibacter sp.]
MIKRLPVTVFCALLFAFNLDVSAQFGGLKKALGKDSSLLSNPMNKLGGKGGGGLSKDEIVSGLKEALKVATDSSTSVLHKADGFFASEAVKILMPEEAKKAEKTLRGMGMSPLVDKAILSMNRAAEDAAGGVTSIFRDAITHMSISDGLNILKGNNDAATVFLRNTTTAQLTEKMRPVIEAALQKANATAYWKDVFTQYNRFSMQKVNPDLTAYVTERTLEGLFYFIAQEEKNIRKNPAARVNDILKKVFAN